MNRIKLMVNSMLVFGVLLAAASFAQAQSTRTWVAGTGSDANTCSRVAPCKGLGGAYVKTSTGGTINVIDASGVGGLVISKSITIDGSESYTGLLGGMGINGITVNTAASDVVVLRGLTLEGNNLGLSGIKFIGGGELHIENCVINNFTEKGISFEPTVANSRLFIKDTIVRNNTGAGLSIQPGAAPASAQVSVDHSRFESNQNGIAALDKAQVTVRDSVVAGNVASGFLAIASGVGATDMYIESSVTTGNGSYGIRASGSGGNSATIRVMNATVVNNGTGLSAAANGTLVTFGNNRVTGNSMNGTFNATELEQ